MIILLLNLERNNVNNGPLNTNEGEEANSSNQVHEGDRNKTPDYSSSLDVPFDDMPQVEEQQTTVRPIKEERFPSQVVDMMQNNLLLATPVPTAYNYICNVCTAAYTTAESLAEHLHCHASQPSPQVNTTGKVRKHACPVCTKRFYRKSDVKRHQNQVHSKGENKQENVENTNRIRNYSCTTCLKRFYKGRDVIRHQITHSTQKPFACNLCGTKFKRAEDRNRHQVKSCRHKAPVTNVIDTNVEIST